MKECIYVMHRKSLCTWNRTMEQIQLGDHCIVVIFVSGQGVSKESEENMGIVFGNKDVSYRKTGVSGRIYCYSCPSTVFKAFII